MIIWIFFALATAAVTAALLQPLSKNRAPSVMRGAGSSAVYRDQLHELERELDAGWIAASEYENAKAETARRLFKANEQEYPAAKPARPSHWLKLAIVVFLPLASMGLYTRLGSPDLPSRPLQERFRNPGGDMAILVRMIESHLQHSSDDGKGWEVLAPIYFRINRIGDAELAYRNVIRLLGPSAARLGDLGEVLVVKADGIVTAEARDVLQQSRALDATDPRTLFYLALALEQEGKTAEAKTAFAALAKQSPPDAPWLAAVNEHIVKNGGQPAASANDKAPGNPTAEDVAAANALGSGDRQQMIRGMVDSLDARLKDDPKNFEGWMRLIRSYAVLNDRARAVDALKRGLAAFPADGGEGRQLLALARELGLPTEGTPQ